MQLGVSEAYLVASIVMMVLAAVIKNEKKGKEPNKGWGAFFFLVGIWGISASNLIICKYEVGAVMVWTVVILGQTCAMVNLITGLWLCIKWEEG